MNGVISLCEWNDSISNADVLKGEKCKISGKNQPFWLTTISDSIIVYHWNSIITTHTLGGPNTDALSKFGSPINESEKLQ